MSSMAISGGGVTVSTACWRGAELLRTSGSARGEQRRERHGAEATTTEARALIAARNR